MTRSGKIDLRTQRKEGDLIFHDVVLKSMGSRSHFPPAVAGSYSERIIYEFIYSVCPTAHPPASPPDARTAWTPESEP